MADKNRFSFAIDRGGTFTDVYAICPNKKIRTMKLLSVDPKNYADAPTEAIRRIIQSELGTSLDPGQPIDCNLINWIRMGTTVATNALLERKGEPTALAVTEGFSDILKIGNQSRPDIFDLKVSCPDVLYSSVVEVSERVVLSHETAQCPIAARKVTLSDNQVIEVWKELDTEKLKCDLTKVLTDGIKSLAIVLINSYIYPNHELKVASIASELGFKYITLSSQVMPMIKVVPRGLTTTADAFLTPHVQRYIDGFFKGFSSKEELNVLFMQSDGGLCPVSQFNGSRAILSGPAGGVIGYSQTSLQEFGDENVAVIGFDMGGTSTDVSRFHRTFDHTYESTTAGITIQVPQLDIKTVAAGGGSILCYRSGLFVVGPESAGAYPGPACYMNGGPLTVTDANLYLGRILPEFFPKIFGPSKSAPLDRAATMKAFDKMAQSINEDRTENKLSNEKIAMGFIRVANEAMSRPIRTITEGKGHDSSNHVLACFGGAGGQHACSIAKSLGIKTVFIHRYSGILSAFGLAAAKVAKEKQEPAALPLVEENYKLIDGRLKKLAAECIKDLSDQGFISEQISVEYYLNLRYEKTDFAIMCQPASAISANPFDICNPGDFVSSFVARYQTEFGFSLHGRTILVDDIRVRAEGSNDHDIATENDQCTSPPKVAKVVKCYFEAGFIDTAVYLMEGLFSGHKIIGPAIVIDANGTILIEPGCEATISANKNILIKIIGSENQAISTKLDRIQLSIFSHRFMSIAEQMGRVLQRTAISTNIKERLDFSCALFGPDGGLVSNAPHIPVHLGAMQKAVQFQIEHLAGDIFPGDVLLSNHPTAGGSHLPDLTVITPVFDQRQLTDSPVFFVASRGHHADIGGVTPGSMPPHSKSIHEEGATFISFKLVDKNVFQESAVRKELMAPAEKPGCSGSRCLEDCISDLKAQIAANNKGINLVQQMIADHGLDAVQAYMKHIQENAEIAVRDMLRAVSGHRSTAAAGIATIEATDHLDDGTQINLKVSIDGESGDAVFDFTGTGIEVVGNLNTPEAVTLSAIIYCLRSMVGFDVPLNQGCLKPIQVIIPKGSILSPSAEAAVVGGNVLTSQRVVDVILAAFKSCAASQGCMNNVTFGDDSLGYYETVAGGSGAGPSWNGTSAVHTHMTNTRITDPEIIEKRYAVMVNKFYINCGTGGRGRFCGGDGVVRELLFRKNYVLSILTERRVFAPYGMNGGQDGKKGRNTLIKADGRKINLGSKCCVDVSYGDVFRLESPGGGGYGTID